MSDEVGRPRDPRVLILWSEPGSPNLGVRALAAGTTALVRSVWPDAELAYQGYGPGDAPCRIGDPRRLARRFGRRHDEFVAWLRGFDLVVDTRAGDSFADIYGVERLVTMSLVHELVRRAGVPLVLGPQTIGPFATRRGRLLARRTVKTAAAVLARDVTSAEVTRTLGRDDVVLTTDVVFALAAQQVDRTRDVVLNVSGLLWQPNPHVDFESYRATVTGLAGALLDAGRQLTVLAHVLDSPNPDNDVPTVRSVGAELGGEVEVSVPGSLDDARAVLASSRLVIGSRMHACLNALSQGVPAIPLAYSRKFEPLLEAIGWRHTVDLRTAARPVDDVLAAMADPGLADAAAAVPGTAAALQAVAQRTLRAAVTRR